MTQLYSSYFTLVIFDANIYCASFGIQERNYLFEKDQFNRLIINR